MSHRFICPHCHRSIDPAVMELAAGPEACYRICPACDEAVIFALASASRVAEAAPGLQLIDPIDAMCDDTRCYTVRQDLPLYRDDDHVSIAMARELAGTLLPLLRH